MSAPERPRAQIRRAASPASRFRLRRIGAIIEAMSGVVDVTTNDQTFRVDPGVILSVAAHTAHSLKAAEASAFILTIGGQGG